MSVPLPKNASCPDDRQCNSTTDEDAFKHKDLFSQLKPAPEELRSVEACTLASPPARKPEDWEEDGTTYSSPFVEELTHLRQPEEGAAARRVQKRRGSNSPSHGTYRGGTTCLPRFDEPFFALSELSLNHSYSIHGCRSRPVHDIKSMRRRSHERKTTLLTRCGPGRALTCRPAHFAAIYGAGEGQLSPMCFHSHRHLIALKASAQRA